MKKLMGILALMFAAGVMTGCNTIDGMGKDIERGGEKLQNKAQDTQQRM
jgi:predicted small secreted protein